MTDIDKETDLVCILTFCQPQRVTSGRWDRLTSRHRKIYKEKQTQREKIPVRHGFSPFMSLTVRWHAAGKVSSVQNDVTGWRLSLIQLIHPPPSPTPFPPTLRLHAFFYLPPPPLPQALSHVGRPACLPHAVATRGWWMLCEWLVSHCHCTRRHITYTQSLSLSLSPPPPPLINRSGYKRPCIQLRALLWCKVRGWIPLIVIFPMTWLGVKDKCNAAHRVLCGKKERERGRDTLDRLADKQTNWQTDRDRPRGREGWGEEREGETETDRHTERDRYTERDRQTDRHRYRQTDWQPMSINQTDQHGNCYKDNNGETSDRRGRAYTGFPASVGSTLNWTDLNKAKLVKGNFDSRTRSLLGKSE